MVIAFYTPVIQEYKKAPSPHKQGNINLFVLGTCMDFLDDIIHELNTTPFEPLEQRNKSFRFNARWAFLTYPQCSIDINTVLRHFVQIEPTLCYGRVAHESHADGGDHLHVLLGFSKKRNIRDVRHFDIQSNHPNIQSVRNVQDVLTYISKGGDYVQYGEPPGTASIWSRICGAGEPLLFWQLAEELDPKSFVINHEKLEYFAQKRFNSSNIEYV